MKRTKNNLIVSGLALVLSAAAFSTTSQAGMAQQTHAPQLNLFPTMVVEAVSDSYEKTRKLESSLKASIEQISQQQQNYKAAQCEQNMGDKGCEQLKKSMVGPFEEILQQVSEQIPSMQAAVDTASKGIGKSLMRNVGRSLTPKQLQDIMMGKSRTRRLKKTNQKGLASSLKSINRALSTNSGNKSHPAFAAEIYLDTLAAKEELAILQDNVAYLLTTSKIRSAMGGLSDSDLTVISSVKALLYGEDDGCNGECLPEPVATESQSSSIKFLREGE